jgi:hypothetical protein
MHVVLAGDLDVTLDAASVCFWRGLQSLGGTSVCYRDAWEATHPGEPGHKFTAHNPLVTAENEDWALELGRRIDCDMVQLIVDDERLRVETSEAYAISLTTGGDQWQSESERTGQPVVEAEFDLAPFRGSYCRVTVVDPVGRRAWSNPIWP